MSPGARVGVALIRVYQRGLSPLLARLKVTAWYDNSDKNPANPDPTKTVHFGDQTWDEMMIGYFTGHLLADGAGTTP